MVLQFPSLKTAVLIFYFVIGHGPPPAVTDAISDAARIVVKNGRSVKTDFYHWEKDYSVFVSITVENWTNYTLLRPDLIIHSGTQILNPTRTVVPARREMFGMRKQWSGAVGTAGAVSWQVAYSNRLFLVMWDAPYSFNHYSNWMGVGMTTKGHMPKPQTTDWRYKMYYGDNETNFNFIRGEFYYNENPISLRFEDFEFVGKMTKGHQAHVTVIFRPIESRGDCLAKQIKDQLGMQNSP
uniref:Coluporin-4 n=1 Tax=Colubraria reticulata TaxID=604273 RepID=A0A499RN76_9CAEN|nr:coluporin-4 [Colubraria reticulata]